MTYSVYDQNGYVGDFCTISGYSALRDYLVGKDPFFDELFDDGKYEDLDKLKEALKAVDAPEDPDIKTSLDALIAYCEECVGILMMTDDDVTGEFAEEETEEESAQTNADPGEVFNEETPGGTYQRTMKGINQAIENLADELFDLLTIPIKKV